MFRQFSLGFALALPVALGAQEGTIAYQHSVKIELPPEVQERFGGRVPRGFPTDRVEEVVLFFNATESLMKPVPPGEGERARPGPAGDRPNFDRMRLSGRRGNALRAMGGRVANETIVESHVRYDANVMVEYREFLGRKFLIEDERPTFAWRLTGEQAELMGYTVQKALTEHEGKAIEAWFTFQIPVPGGPAMYGGLPGMILVVSVDDGQEQYNAEGISLADIADDVIVEPTEGDRVTREEYEGIVEEKLEELRIVGGEGD